MLTISLILLLLAPSARAEKTVVNSIGGAEVGTTGGLFNNPRGVAVNQTGAGGVPAGTVYVVDGSNNRIQQFSPTGAFVRTWGWGVKDGANELQVCTVAVDCRKGASLKNDAGALNAPIGVAVDQSTGNVYVTAQSGRRVNVYNAAGNFFGAWGWAVRTAAAELQFCTSLTGCKVAGAAAPASGDVGGGQFGTQIGNLAVGPEGNVFVADKTSRRIQVFKPTLVGTAVIGVEFLRAYGWGAATGAEAFEVCTTPICKAPAAAGAGLGQFATNSPTDVALDAAGNVYALDAGNKRVQKFDSASTPVSAEFGAAALTGAFGTGELSSIAVQPETESLFVAGSRAAADGRVAVLELNSEGNEVELSGADLAPTTSAGLAAAKPSLGENVYLASNSEGQRVYVINQAPTIEPVSAIGAHEATFSGEVLSDGLFTTFRFEYSTNGTDWTSLPEEAAGAEPGWIPVTQTATGLLPDTEYSVRLVATRAAGGGSTNSVPVQFTTATSAPTIEATFASQIGSESATLAAYLNPEKSPTTWRFEYGTSTAYGQTVPATAANAGSGTARVTVSRPVADLSPGTTYHFRLVATNAHGTTQGPDATFTTLPAAPPLGGRAYEMVSPPDKHGSDVITVRAENHNNLYFGQDFAPISSVEGDSVAFTSFGSFANAPSHGVFTPYLAVRSSSGWTTTNLSVRMDGASTTSPTTWVEAFTPDLSSRVILGPRFPQLTPEAAEGVNNAYLWDGSTYRLMTPGAEEESQMATTFVAGSTDLRHSYFRVFNGGPLTEETPPGVFEADGLYDWNASTGELEYVGIEPGGTTAFPGSVFIASPYSTISASLPNPWNPVSDDGRIAYFQTGEPAQLYARVDGSETVHVSASQATPPDPVAQPARFHWASADGETAFFSSAEKLTDDATTGPMREGRDLYRYDLASEQLTDITVDPTDPNGAEVQGVIGGSQSGDKLYFVAKGVLAPGAVFGENNLYLWSDDGSPKGSIEFISTGVDEPNWEGILEFSDRRMGRVTPNGSHVLFQTTDRITQYDNDGKYQVYVYSVESDSLQCASCNPLARPASHDAIALGGGDAVQAARTITDDGRFVFFNTREALLAADVNGMGDVYAFDTRAGGVSLVSPGTGPFPAEFTDASADGGDIFFGTRQQLVRIDTDENLDVYDARVGGGLASQNPPLTAPCVGEACRPAEALPPAASSPASATFHGAGNEKRPNGKPKKKKKANKKKGSKKKGKQKKGKQQQKKGKKNRAQHDRRAGR